MTSPGSDVCAMDTIEETRIVTYDLRPAGCRSRSTPPSNGSRATGTLVRDA